ncbi:MAG: glucosamine-6-phosphate deaminase [Candidatus Atribacteria bacterium]|nr:MAG: glucosamine-6-phosphate deaminase [Candidatus Atribacteria bacterium]
MEVTVFDTKAAMGIAAAAKGVELIAEAIKEKGYANIILATGASQFEMLGELVKAEVDWSKVTAFHLDEYIGIPDTHPASFRKYLKERFVELVSPAAFHAINGETDPETECLRLGAIIAEHEIDVAFVGIGENGHLAFNDPPADFETLVPYLVVDLDLVCRKQQLGEGWFPSLEAVPERAISMSVRQIMKSKAIICTVPDTRKAEAVKKTLEGEVAPEVPASVLQNHPQTWLYLDRGSASMMKPE